MSPKAMFQPPGSCQSQAVLRGTSMVRLHDGSFFRQAVRLGYWSVISSTFDHVISIADDRLFEKVSMDHSHSLHLLLPAEHTNLRRRSHYYVLSIKTSVNSPNFISRLLYKKKLLSLGLTITICFTLLNSILLLLLQIVLFISSIYVFYSALFTCHVTTVVCPFSIQSSVIPTNY